MKNNTIPAIIVNYKVGSLSNVNTLYKYVKKILQEKYET